jgi:hypothetical protein
MDAPPSPHLCEQVLPGAELVQDHHKLGVAVGYIAEVQLHGVDGVGAKFLFPKGRGPRGAGEAVGRGAAPHNAMWDARVGRSSLRLRSGRRAQRCWSPASPGAPQASPIDAILLCWVQQAQVQVGHLPGGAPKQDCVGAAGALSQRARHWARRAHAAICAPLLEHTPVLS